MSTADEAYKAYLEDKLAEAEADADRLAEHLRWRELEADAAAVLAAHDARIRPIAEVRAELEEWPELLCDERGRAYTDEAKP